MDQRSPHVVVSMVQLEIPMIGKVFVLDRAEWVDESCISRLAHQHMQDTPMGMREEGY